MLLLKDAIQFYDKFYFENEKNNKNIPTMDDILAFKKCEKDLQKLIRKMRVKRRKNWDEAKSEKMLILSWTAVSSRERI